jgi:hypothetical protein
VKTSVVSEVKYMGKGGKGKKKSSRERNLEIYEILSDSSI